MLSFATRVMSDPEITHDVKMDLYTQVIAESSNWSDVGLIQPMGELELAKAINNGEDVQAVLEQLDGITKKHVDHPASQKNFQEYFTRAAADLYATYGDFQQAATQLSRMDKVTDWQAGVEHFLRKGGDVSLVRAADTMRHDFDAAMFAPDSKEYKAARWDLRPLVTDLFEYTSQNPDATKARAALLEVAERGRNNLAFNRVSMQVVEKFADRLLELDPTAVEIGPELIARMGWKTDFLSIYELFARHGSKEMEAAGWEYVNCMHVPDRTFYLVRYASMALTSHMIEQS
jgi:hypothetical protein